MQLGLGYMAGPLGKNGLGSEGLSKTDVRQGMAETLQSGRRRSYRNAGNADGRKEIIVFMHYPPIIKENLDRGFMRILKKYNIKRCYYAHVISNLIGSGYFLYKSCSSLN